MFSLRCRDRGWRTDREPNPFARGVITSGTTRMAKEAVAREERPSPGMLARFEALAPRPRTIAESGLPEAFLEGLTAKHLLDRGVSTMADLADRMALAGTVVEELIVNRSNS